MARTGRLTVRVPGYPHRITFADWTYEKDERVAAEQFMLGNVTYLWGKRVNACMLDIAAALTRGGEFDLTDEVLASAALGLAEVKVPASRFDKDGFAPGVKRDTGALVKAALARRVSMLTGVGFSESEQMVARLKRQADLFVANLTPTERKVFDLRFKKKG